MSDTVTEEKTAEEAIEEVVENMEESPEEQQEENNENIQEQEEGKVPLSALKKVRKEAQEAKMKAELLNQQIQQFQNGQSQQQMIDNSNDLMTVGQSQDILEQWKRNILEESYMEQYPEIVQRIENELPEILNKHKWLGDSLKQAPNRLHRAKEILEMFHPKKQAVPPPNRNTTPKSPQSVAKANNVSSADRIMQMSDDELEQWRLSQKRKIR